MLKKIIEAINEFDPLDLLPFAPPDEYDKEINEIYSFLENSTNCDVNMLANKIYSVFETSLGNDIFLKSIEDCRSVAEEILKEENE